MKVLVVVLAFVVLARAEEKVREKREAKQGYDRGHKVETRVYEKHYYKPKPKQCYQCAYSPPKTYYNKKVYVEHGEYGKRYDSYGQGRDHGSYGRNDGYRGNDQRGYHGGYTRKTVVPVPYTIYGGWDKCIGPFSKYEAKNYGIDEWDCHSNCYTRRDRNGDVFRGCYKGEYGVNPYKLGCHKQAGAVWCFCSGDKCNNGPSPH